MPVAPALRDLFLLRPDVVFLNHGAFGACPRPVFEAYQRWQEELEGQPVEFLGRRFRDLLHEAREALGAFVGADPQDLVYVPNATVGVNIAARSLPLGPGDEVLSTDHEYGALRRMWRTVCEERGARYIEARVPVPVTSGEEIVERIWGHVSSRTRVLLRGVSSFLDELEWQGTQDLAAYLAVSAAIRFQREHHWDGVREECHTLVREARDRLSGVTGLDPLSPDSPEWYAQMVSLPLPPVDARRVQRRLLEECAIEAPVFSWNNQALLRICIQGYNTRSDVDAVVSAVPRVLNGA